MRHSMLLAALICMSVGCYHDQPEPTTRSPERFGAFVPGSNGRLASDTAFVSGQPSNADYTSPAIDASGMQMLWIMVSLDGTSSPAGAFSVLVSGDCTNYDTANLDAGKVFGTTNGAIYSHAGGQTISYSGSSASRFQIPLLNTPPCVKVLMDQSSGGTTGARLSMQWFGVYPKS